MNELRGRTVHWITGDCEAKVIKETEFGDIIIQPVGSKLPITTRRCFIIVKDGE